MLITLRTHSKPDKREFLKIGQAVGVGFLVMGVIGYIVKLSKYPLLYPAERREEKKRELMKSKTHSSHPCQQHSRRWRIKVLPAHTRPSFFSISLLPFSTKRHRREQRAIIPFRKIRQKTARYLFATHLSKYFSRVLIFCIIQLYNFSFYSRARAPLALRENKKKEPFFQSIS
jgi:protein translocase SEC61 complex gamma subunit